MHMQTVCQPEDDKASERDDEAMNEILHWLGVDTEEGCLALVRAWEERNQKMEALAQRLYSLGGRLLVAHGYVNIHQPIKGEEAWQLACDIGRVREDFVRWVQEQAANGRFLATAEDWKESFVWFKGSDWSVVFV